MKRPYEWIYWKCFWYSKCFQILLLWYVTMLNTLGSQIPCRPESALDDFCRCLLRDLRSAGSYQKFSQGTYRDHLAMHTSFEVHEVAVQLKWSLQRCSRSALQLRSDPLHDLPSEELNLGFFPPKQHLSIKRQACHWCQATLRGQNQ